MELTEWYEENQKPEYVGVYERQYPFGTCYCYWSGKNWHRPTTTLVYASSIKTVSQEQKLKWRGVKK